MNNGIVQCGVCGKGPVVFTAWALTEREKQLCASCRDAFLGTAGPGSDSTAENAKESGGLL